MFKIEKINNKRLKTLKNNQQTNVYTKKNVLTKPIMSKQKLRDFCRSRLKRIIKYRKVQRLKYAERFLIKEKIKKKMENPVILSALQKRCYVLNILYTRTNMFITVTTYNGGKVLLSKSAKMAGYAGPKKRMKEVTFVLLDLVLNQLKKIIPWNKRKNTKIGILQRPVFIIAFRGSKNWKHVKIVKYLVRKIRLNVWRVIEKPDYPFNGCRLKIKKRKKKKHKKKPPTMPKRVRIPWIPPKPKPLRSLFLSIKKNFSPDTDVSYFWQKWKITQKLDKNNLSKEKLRLKAIVCGLRRLATKDRYNLLTSKKNMGLETYIYLTEKLLYPAKFVPRLALLVYLNKKFFIKLVNEQLSLYEKKRRKNLELFGKLWNLKLSGGFKKFSYKKRSGLLYNYSRLRGYLVTLTYLINLVRRQKQKLRE